MDLKEYIEILRKNLTLFLVIIAIIIAGSFLFLTVKPVSYTTSLMLNIARSGSQQTTDYKFDEFYRIQADEKFAETIVQWLGSPAVVADIFSGAGINTEEFSLRQLAKSFKAEKLSAQVVAVSFNVTNTEQARNISASISEIISKNIQSLNQDMPETGWFIVRTYNPITIENSYSTITVLLASFLAGAFIAFWIVLITHYLK